MFLHSLRSHRSCPHYKISFHRRHRSPNEFVDAFRFLGFLFQVNAFKSLLFSAVESFPAFVVIDSGEFSENSLLRFGERNSFGESSQSPALIRKHFLVNQSEHFVCFYLLVLLFPLFLVFIKNLISKSNSAP